MSSKVIDSNVLHTFLHETLLCTEKPKKQNYYNLSTESLKVYTLIMIFIKYNSMITNYGNMNMKFIPIYQMCFWWYQWCDVS